MPGRAETGTAGSSPSASFSGPSSLYYCLSELSHQGVTLCDGDPALSHKPLQQYSCNSVCHLQQSLGSAFTDVFSVGTRGVGGKAVSFGELAAQWSPVALLPSPWSVVRPVICNMNIDGSTCGKCPLSYIPLIEIKCHTCSP